MFHFIRGLAYLPMAMVYPTKIVGRKNLPKGKAIITMNHTSNLDAIVFLLNTYEKKYFLAKKELFKSKARSWFLKKMGAIKIDRASADVNAIKEAFSVLKAGKKLVIFPEGTRNKSDDLALQEVKHGAAMIAIKTKTPIVPLWINNRPKSFRMTKILIGKPYELSEFYGQKLTDEVLGKASEIIAEKLNELKEEAKKMFNKKERKNGKAKV